MNEYNVDLQSLRDLTNKLTSNGYLIDRAAQWEYAFDAVQDLVMIVNPSLKIKFVNKAFSKRLKLLKRDFLDKSCFQILHCPNCKRTPGDCLVSYGSKPETVKHDDIFIKDLEGWFNFSHSPIYDEDDHLLGFICILHDVTGRKKVEIALKESEEKYRHLIKYAPAGIYEIDFVNDRFISVNDVMCINTGYSEDELLNKIKPTAILTERSLKAYTERLKKIFDGKEPPTTFEVEVTMKNGEIFWANLNVKFKRKYGKIVGASVISHDITERKKIEIALKENEALLKSIFKASGAGIGLTDGRRNIVWSNAKLREMTGYEEEELEGQSVRLLYNDDEEFNFVGEVGNKQIKTEGVANIETVWKRKDGRLIRILLSCAPIDPKDWFKGITLTALDITNF